jgi:hypothetical protein
MPQFDIFEEDEIPYREQADLLFHLPGSSSDSKQRLIPFLGAGVSISGRNFAPASALSHGVPDVELLDKFASELKLKTTSAKTFLRIAVFLAVNLNTVEHKDCTEDQLLESLLNEEFPPSAGELTEMLAQLSDYTTFRPIIESLKKILPEGLIEATDNEQISMLKHLAAITGIVNPGENLMKISSYYENKVGRGSLWAVLSQIFSEKSRITATHNLVAVAAKHHLDQPKAGRHYLILTTNYDSLMEEALANAGVDYVTLVTRKSDQKVLAQFSESIENADELEKMNSGLYYASDFFLMSPMPFAIIHKLHGSLDQQSKDHDDSVVISEDDYVDYIANSSSATGVLPAYVKRLLIDKQIIFLGYSLSDLNIQRIVRSLDEERLIQHYAVTSRLDERERLNFQRLSVRVLKTDLNRYVSGVLDIVGQSVSTPRSIG